MNTEVQQMLKEKETILEIIKDIKADLRSFDGGPVHADLKLELKRWEGELKEVNEKVSGKVKKEKESLKSDLKSVKKRIKEAERKQYEQQIRNQYDDSRKRQKDKAKSDAHIDSLYDLRDSILKSLGGPIPEEVTRTSKYKTFNSWSKGRPTGQGKVKFWRGRP